MEILDLGDPARHTYVRIWKPTASLFLLRFLWLVNPSSCSSLQTQNKKKKKKKKTKLVDRRGHVLQTDKRLLAGLQAWSDIVVVISWIDREGIF